jgi:8-oxo-dGTP pyrophosphatase MutT (NUDIX family)
MLRVAIGIIQNAEEHYLLGLRPQGKPLAGFWEFPGGKIEATETPYEALCRELEEELGITVISAKLLFDYIYTHSMSSCDIQQPQPSSGAYVPVHEQRGQHTTKSQLERRRIETKRKIFFSVWQVIQYRDEPQPLATDELRWVAKQQLAHHIFPPPNRRILQHLGLPLCTC